MLSRISVKLLMAALCCVVSLTGTAEPIKFITLDVAPWASTQDGQMQGAFIEMVKEISARTGLETSISLTPFARVDRELETGGHDCTILIPRGEESVVHGELVSYHQIGLIPRNGLTLNGYEDLSGKRISLLRGSAITPQFDADDSLDKVYDTDYLIALRKLGRARIDAIAGAIPTIRYLADQNGLSDTMGEPLTLADVPLIFQCSQKSTHLEAMPEINRAIQAMIEEGDIERIRQEYYF